MENEKVNLLDISYPQFKEFVASLGEAKYRADQLLNWIYRKQVTSFDDMTDLPPTCRQKLSSSASLLTLIPQEEKISANGRTRKILFKLDDGKTIESTLMIYPPKGNSRERRTVCISTQVGCHVRCPFCATGQQGFERNLRTGEIIEQILYFMRLMQHKIISGSTDTSRRPVTNIVFMGMGEPLANYEALGQAVIILNSPWGLKLSARQIAISTAGLVPAIRRLAGESIHVELAVSLHAAVNKLRDRLVPLNKRYPLEQLIPACREYLEKTGRRPTFEYALFQNINDSPDDARHLMALLQNFNCQVNLIAGNPTSCKDFLPSTMRQAQDFQKILTAGGISNTIRVPMGLDIEAGCGQLRSRWLAQKT